MGITTRTFAPGHFVVEIDGVIAGYARNVQGGGAVAEVIKEKVGTDHIVHKHIGQVSYDDIVLTCDAGLSKVFYDWVEQMSGSKGIRRNGAVVVLEGGKAISRLDWTSGMISELYFPALDQAARDSFVLTVKITPERTQSRAGGESRPVTAARKSWLSNSFHLSIEGLEEACKRVSRIERILLGRKVVKNPTGEMRDYEMEPGTVDPGNLVISLPESAAKGFYDWFDDFVIKGNNDQSRERRGTLESGTFSLLFGNLGISRITRPSNLPGAAIRNIQVEMYCESIRFSAKVAA